MWMPKTESEINQAVQSGSLEESAIFDAKEDIPPKNPEIAKDIAAMANDGGVIIYGIGEDEHGRLTRLTPISLENQAEKIDAIVRSSIAEPPEVHIFKIPTAADPTSGYLVVLIPQSARAPHMVIVKGEHRYYGRTATGNAILSEGEVSRLYARRQQKEIDREKLIEAEINDSPLEPNANFAYLFLFARPVFTKESFFEPALSNGSNLQTILNELVEQVSSGNVFKRIFQPDFNPSRTWKYRAEALWAQMDYPTSEASEIPRYTLNLQIDFNGTGHLFCGKAADKYLKGPLLAYPELIAGLTVRFITYMAKLYEKARYVGLVDMGIALTGLKGCVANTNAHYLQYSSPPYDCDSYKKSGQFSAIQMLDDPLISSKYLVMSFIKAISQDRIDPFRQK